jgi:hypothetical protein
MTELDNVLGRMREVLDGEKTAQAIEAVRERAREAGDVQGMAELYRREQSSVYEPNLTVTGPGR